MGSLSELRLPTVEVEVAEGATLTIRGLAVADLTDILKDHALQLDSLYQTHIVGGAELPAMDVLGRALLTEVPEVAARLIAAANDDPDSHEMAAKLPALVQMNALVALAQLTFRSEAEVKKLMETMIAGTTLLSSLLNGMGSQSLPPTSTNGSGASEAA